MHLAFDFFLERSKRFEENQSLEKNEAGFKNVMMEYYSWRWLISKYL